VKDFTVTESLLQSLKKKKKSATSNLTPKALKQYFYTTQDNTQLSVQQESSSKTLMKFSQTNKIEPPLSLTIILTKPMIRILQRSNEEIIVWLYHININFK